MALLNLLKGLIILIITTKINTDFRFLKWELFELSEEFIELDYATTMDKSVFSINASSIRAIDSIIGKFKLWKKDSNGEFREIYKNFPEFDWCSVMKSASKFSTNIFAKGTVLFCKKVIPEFIHQCPFPPINLQRANASLPFQFQVMIPSGIYRLIVIVKTKSGSIFIHASGIWEIY